MLVKLKALTKYDDAYFTKASKIIGNRIFSLPLDSLLNSKDCIMFSIDSYNFWLNPNKFVVVAGETKEDFEFLFNLETFLLKEEKIIFLNFVGFSVRIRNIFICGFSKTRDIALELGLDSEYFESIFSEICQNILSERQDYEGKFYRITIQDNLITGYILKDNLGQESYFNSDVASFISSVFNE